MSVQEEYFVIDTDGGPDDAVAIMLAVDYIRNQHTNKKILGITCTTGNTTIDKVVRNVLLTLKIMKEKDIKVYSASHCSLLNNYASREYYGEDGLGNSVSYYESNDLKAEKENGVEALISFVKKYPKRVTILCLGPLTNLALAYLIDDQFFEFTKEIFILGGNINATLSPDFNFHFDTEAAHIVLKNAVCPAVIVSLEVYRNCRIHWELYKQLIEISTEKSLFFKRITQFVVENLDNDNVNGIKLADRLLVAIYLNPKTILESRRWDAEIELSGKMTRGQLVVKKEQETRSGFNFVTNIDEYLVNEMTREMLLRHL